MRWSAVLALLTLQPALSAAQRVEIAPFVGRYHPVATTWSTSSYDFGNYTPEDDIFVVLTRVERKAATVLGGRIGLQYSPQFGVEAIVQHARAVNPLLSAGTGLYEASESVASTFIAVQPSLRIRVDEFIEVGVSGGPAIALVSAETTQDRLRATRSASYLGVAVAGAIRAHLTPRVALELRASDTWTFGSGGAAGALHHLMYGVGLAFGVRN